MFHSGVGDLGGVGCCLFVGIGLAWGAVAVLVVLGGGEVMVWCVRGLLFGLFEILQADRLISFRLSAMEIKI